MSENDYIFYRLKNIIHAKISNNRHYKTKIVCSLNLIQNIFQVEQCQYLQHTLNDVRFGLLSAKTDKTLFETEYEDRFFNFPQSSIDFVDILKYLRMTELNFTFLIGFGENLTCFHSHRSLTRFCQCLQTLKKNMY